MNCSYNNVKDYDGISIETYKNDYCNKIKSKNCIDAFRIRKGITYAKLGIIMNTTSQNAFSICKSKNPKYKTIELLANHEKISVY